jgi:EAL and modified HD-GYP domain-containing signal transduction protein
MSIFVARQPIYDTSSRLIGYELLYRTNAQENWASGADPKQMSSDVIIHSVLNIGLDRITGGRTAFLNFTSDMLATDIFELLDPRAVVIELLETSGADDYTLRACERLRAAGYKLALDDFGFDDGTESLLPLAHIVKVDVLERSAEEVGALVERLRPFPLVLLAEKIETAAMHERCRALGFHLFQGYHFSRPEILEKRDLPVDGVAIIRLMNLLRDPDTGDAAIEEAFRTSPALSYQLLRIVNSAQHGGRGIQSILHAIRLLGRDMLHRWLSLLFVSSLMTRNDVDTERALTVIGRARLCELMAEASGRKALAGPLFLVGLFSGLDALLQMPLVEVVEQIDLAAPVREAVLERSGPYGPALALALAYESGSWDDVPALAEGAGVGAEAVTDLYLQSLTWARERLRSLGD